MQNSLNSSSEVKVQKQPYVRPELRKQGRIEDMTQGNLDGLSNKIHY